MAEINKKIQKIFDAIEQAEAIVDSNASWETKFNIVFAMGIHRDIREIEPDFDWYDPDTSYQEDVSSYVLALREWRRDMGKLNEPYNPDDHVEEDDDWTDIQEPESWSGFATTGDTQELLAYTAKKTIEMMLSGYEDHSLEALTILDLLERKYDGVSVHMHNAIVEEYSRRKVERNHWKLRRMPVGTVVYARFEGENDNWAHPMAVVNDTVHDRTVLIECDRNGNYSTAKNDTVVYLVPDDAYVYSIRKNVEHIDTNLEVVDLIFSK